MSILASPAAALALAAGLMFAPMTGMMSWPSLARGRVGGTLVGGAAMGLFVFSLARLIGVPAGG